MAVLFDALAGKEVCGMIGTQMQLQEVSDEYREFVEKFKPKKTTDDCYTPENVYEAIKGWAVNEYGIDPDSIVRPFWPGGDYERFDYPDGCVVLDNPPFSILSQIVRNYLRNGIRFFLFSPYLTNFSCGDDERVCHVVCDAQIMYANGAIVSTCFLTNMDMWKVRSVPDLRAIIKAEDDKNRKEKVKTVPKYIYPDEVLCSTDLGYMSKHGIELKISAKDMCFIRSLDMQDKVGKAIFGGGFLLSERAAAERAAAERAAAERWELSEREREIVRRLGG